MPRRTDPGELERLRHRTSEINRKILDLLNERASMLPAIQEVKARLRLEGYSPAREQEMLEELITANPGPFPDDAVRQVFKEVFRAFLGLMETEKNTDLRVSRHSNLPDILVRVGDRTIGGGTPVIIAGPCSVESEEQLEEVAAALAAMGVGFLRGGAFKPRTSPYAFQGLGVKGLHLLAAAGKRHGMAVVTEAVDTRTVHVIAEHADVVQVGSRNMANYELLKAVAACGRPVLLKRGFAATLDEFVQAAEYIAAGGNEQIILCERGIRTFEQETRFTLDISAVPLLQGMTRLPIIVDVSHSAGRRDILSSLARASLAAGANGVMIEVHPNPAIARSDNQQQLDIAQFRALLAQLQRFLAPV
jgi:3-deoxy-7-phosphoheptulonate synthase/chorismate mutase